MSADGTGVTRLTTSGLTGGVFPAIGSPAWSPDVVPVTGAQYQWQLCTPKECARIKSATKPTLKLIKAASAMVTVRPRR
jgi:hypothetical protein